MTRNAATTVKVGIIDDIEVPTVLFIGDSDAMYLFAEYLSSIMTNHAVTITNNCLFEPKGAISILLEIVNDPYGMVRSAPMAFRWGVTLEILREFATLVIGVARSKEACHQYLEIGNNKEVHEPRGRILNCEFLSRVTSRRNRQHPR
jgi:hypothetical protein